MPFFRLNYGWNHCPFRRRTNIPSINMSITLRHLPRLALPLFNPRHAGNSALIFGGVAGGDVIAAGPVVFRQVGEVEPVV